jgi:hypothetical protein
LVGDKLGDDGGVVHFYGKLLTLVVLEFIEQVNNF